MPVTTRYQNKAALYTQVLNEPLMLSHIVTHLSAKDIINLKTTLSKQESRFHDTLNDVLIDQFDDYVRKKKNEKQMSFMDDIQHLIHSISNSINMDIQFQIAQMNKLFDYLVKNKWFLTDDMFDPFQKIVENKLIEQLITHPYEYSHYAIYYLEVLFNVHVKMFVDEDTGEGIEYIQDRDGNMIIW